MNRTTKLAVGGFAAVAAMLGGLAVTRTPSTKPGVFYSTCQFDHAAPDDPIVFPAQPGASHLHDFFGRVGIDADTRPERTPGQPTTCSVDGDSAGYWTPALYVNGTKITPELATARYSTGGKPVDTLQSFPPGLQMIAGPNAKQASFGCKPGRSANAPLGCGKAWGTGVVTFPDCWNGTDLDSADHRSHMAYSIRGTCPVTHPVPVPSLTLKVHYRHNLPATGDVTLASGVPATLHADFLNSWNQDRLEELVETCIRHPKIRGKKCTSVEPT